MPISENDNEDVRQKRDKQDRMDAEELMVVAMSSCAGSVGSRSSISSVSSANQSISKKRRNRPPRIPSPPSFLEVIPARSWNVRRVFSVTVASIAVTAVSTVGVVFAVQNSRHVSTSTAPVILVDKPVRLREVPSQHHRVQHTKYSGQRIPSFFQQNAKDFADVSHYGEIPVLWRIPFSGDEAFTQIFGVCSKLTQAADEKELLVEFLGDSELKYVSTPSGLYFNLDLSDQEGIEQAKHINLAALDRLDIITSPVLNVLGLFDDLTLQSRVFCTMRHPAKRLVTFFYGSKDVKSRYYDPALIDVTIDQYAAWPGDRLEFNFMVKSLVSSGNELITTDEITADDLSLAKTILSQKFMIMIAEDKLGSWTKLQTWLGWSSTQEQRVCEDNMLKKEWPAIRHPPLGNDESAFEKLLERNKWDMELYQHALGLFQQQSEVLVK